MTIDPIALAQALIRCPSVTPADEGALDTLARALEPVGFSCRRMPFEAPGTARVDNLYAKITGKRPGRHFSFAGHSDVVPVGKRASWSVDPFAAKIIDGRLYGRGAADMKGAVAAFAAAAARFVARTGGDFAGAISLLITGDEEGPSVNGTKPMLRTLAAEGEKIDACLVGEPTNPRRLGEMAKIGRRGSWTGHLTVKGVQGHIAYPHLADNPTHRLARMVVALTEAPLDPGTAHFEPSTLQVSTIDVGNPSTNVIPAEARASFNSRFNDGFTPESLETEVRRRLETVGGEYELRTECSGVSFVTPPGPLSDLVTDAVKAVTGLNPELSTTGGTSDARFIKDYCPVIEFGLAGATMHKVDENVTIADILQLSDIYEHILHSYFDAKLD
ncbi:succinyl-diaminopimelate desuccinylase [Dongia deserti]|uniref:succinyl-diaminopimelate desuccinylase n=1 Tax=Dongia deserti TaxID=2268030 RepID=UPI000E65E0A9|nr:succinyl-diaminopimelate desuccinylase [Dongia deserti]